MCKRNMAEELQHGGCCTGLSPQGVLSGLKSLLMVSTEGWLNTKSTCVSKPVLSQYQG